MSSVAERARAVAAAAPRHQSAEVLRECADEIDRLRADLAALRAVVMGLPEYECTGACEESYCYTAVKYLKDWKCQCYATPANAALAAAKKMAGGE